nr:ABC transporter permease [Clostridia bacterium]
MNNNVKSVREPLFHISKRGDVSLKRQILTRVIAVAAGLILGSIVCTIAYGSSPFDFLYYLVEGNFKPFDNFWEMIKKTALLLMIGLALIPAFKMKYWNLGGNGQILMGGLITIICMINLGDTVPDGVVWMIMLLAAMLVGAIWAVIPALFKAFFKTNETLFTLMMNYIAVGLVAYAIKKIGGKESTGTIGVVQSGQLPELGHSVVLILIFAIIITLFITFYIKSSKHGYEVSLVGDSENTARYGGINVKKTIIRTLILSGAICGIVGFLLAGSINHTIVTEETMANSGFTAFTAIIVVWIAHNNPLATIGVSFGVIFINNGMMRVQSSLSITEKTVPDMIIGIMYLIIIACEFFITFRIKFNKKKNETIKTVEEVK